MRYDAEPMRKEANSTVQSSRVGGGKNATLPGLLEDVPRGVIYTYY